MRPRTVALLVALAAAAAAPSRTRAAAEPPTIERIAAVVNSEVILYSEVKERAAQSGTPIDEGATPESHAKAQQVARQVLDKMVDDTLILEQASDLKLSVEVAEVDRAIEEVKKQNNLDGAQFEQALGEQGYTLASYRKDLKRQILRLKVVNTAVRARINVSDEEVRAFYDQSARQSGGHRQAHVRHVLVLVPDGSKDAEIERRRRIAARVVEEARGGEEFAQLAKRYSEDDATKNDGGDLGWVKEGEGLPEAFAEVVFSMDTPKEVRGPIRTDKGFEVVQLVERKEGDVRPFDEVKDQLKQQLYGQQLDKQTNQWLQELRKKAHVDERL
jgi:peptidyl-prolyl cis-trans isomerase SurA